MSGAVHCTAVPADSEIRSADGTTKAYGYPPLRDISSRARKNRRQLLVGKGAIAGTPILWISLWENALLRTPAIRGLSSVASVGSGISRCIYLIIRELKSVTGA